ncbi:MAG TPA: hypothetical protein VGX91_12990 [Candidatus Cybelea sp.]|jgi:hypothetical protein|nr:hypothetical protein [Candidatus Cybelea sp.]
MKINRSLVGPSAFVLLIATALVTGCNSGLGGLSPAGQSLAPGGRPLDDPSNIVRIFNPGSSGAIYGNVTEACGITAQPSPLPTIGVGEHKRVTLTVTGGCGSLPSINVDYGPAKSGHSCTLIAGYSAVSQNWGYNVINDPGMGCFANPAPPSANYNEDFAWWPCLSGTCSSGPLRPYIGKRKN